VLHQVGVSFDLYYDARKHKIKISFDDLLTVHLSIIISVINHVDAHSFVLQYVYFIPLHVSSTCTHHQEIKIELYSLWYHRVTL
jgi:hypothetical protein